VLLPRGGGLTSERAVRIERAGAGEVDALRDLFLAMHRHHRALVALPLVDDDEAWAARRATYLAWFGEGRARLFLAKVDGVPAGYAILVLHDGTDDTFPLAPEYAELYSLSVAEGLRGSGIGGRLLDAVDAELADGGDPPLVLSVMADNADALRFYERRGLVPGEILLYRFREGRAVSS
jgi:ribosomal protein S18 acetylase RimI-like enzyme